MGCTTEQNTLTPPFTTSQFVRQVTDLNYTDWKAGDYNNMVLVFDGNKISVADANDLNVALPDLTGFVPYSGASQTVNLIPQSLYAGNVLVNESSPYDNSVSFEVNGKGGFNDGTFSAYFSTNNAAGKFEDGVSNVVELSNGTNAITATGTTVLTGGLYNEGSSAGYDLDVGTIDGYGNNIPAGLKPDSYGLPIIDFGINPFQWGGIADTTSKVMGSMFRLDNRGIYPYFQLIRQPADDTYSEEYGDLVVSATDGSVLAGDGWNFSNYGTGNGEDIQSFENAFVGGTLNIAGGSGTMQYYDTDKVINGTFTGNANSWVVPTGWAYSSNTIVHNSNGTGSLSQNVGIVAGKQYRLTLTMSARTVGGINIYAGGTNVGVITSNATAYTWSFLALDDSNLFLEPTISTSRFTLDNIKVEEVRYTAGNILVGDYNYLPNRIVPNLGVHGTSVLDGNVNISNDLRVDGNFFGNQIYGNLFGEDISQNVVIGLANTYYDFNSGLNGDGVNGFSFDRNKLKASVKGKYLVNWSLSFTNNQSDQTIAGLVGVNSTPIIRTENATRAKENGVEYSIAGSGLVDMNVGQWLGFMLENETGASTVTIKHATLTLTRLGN